MIDWTITNMERDASTGGVSIVNWKASAVIQAEEIISAGKVHLTPDPTSPGFVAFEALTDDIVKGWVWGSVDKAAIEAGFGAELDITSAPNVALGLPWGG